METKLEPAVDELMKGWRTLAQFHMRPKHFRQGKMSYEGHDNAKLYIFKLSLWLKQIITQERSTMTKEE